MTTMKKIKGMLSPLEERIQVLETRMDQASETEANAPVRYVVNFAKGRFHQTNCSCLQYSDEKNLLPVTWDRQTCMDSGLKPCKHCRS